MWELDCEESWVPKNLCFWTVVLEKTLESPLDCKEIKPVHLRGRSVLGVHWKNWCWSWTSSTLATSWEELTDWKRPWCWEGLGAGGEGDDGGWDGWMASPTWWTWVWVNSRSWRRTGRPGMLQFMGSQRVRHDWVTELNWIWAIVSSQSCFWWLYRTSLPSAAKNIINLISVLTIWWCPCIESSLVLLEEGVCYDQCIALEKMAICKQKPQKEPTPWSWTSKVQKFKKINFGCWTTQSLVFVTVTVADEYTESLKRGRRQSIQQVLGVSDVHTGGYCW